jgi:EPS-associated MarR family transcriptional regulator
MKHLEETVKLLNHIHENPESTQRILVEELDFSLGKVNYLIKALAEKGIIKLKRFKSSRKKAGYLYLLTPKGVKRKAEITRKFLEQRLDEYDKLQEEIKMLKMRLKATGESQD